MFQSITYKGYNPKTNQYEYELIDSDFATTAIAASGIEVVALIQEYHKRSLPIGKNLTLYVLWHQRTYKSDITKYIDKNLPDYLESGNGYYSDLNIQWWQIKKEMNYYLEQYGVFQ